MFKLTTYKFRNQAAKINFINRHPNNENIARIIDDNGGVFTVTDVEDDGTVHSVSFPNGNVEELYLVKKEVVHFEEVAEPPVEDFVSMTFTITNAAQAKRAVAAITGAWL